MDVHMNMPKKYFCLWDNWKMFIVTGYFSKISKTGHLVYCIWLFVVLNGFRFYPAGSWQPRFITTNTSAKNALLMNGAYFIR